MMTSNNYHIIQSLKETNPQAYQAITETLDAHLETLSFASHEIKNMIAFMNSSYQFISMKHPETSEFKFWNQFGTNIDNMINFMDRTSAYRYCMKPTLELVNISDILYCLPDKADTRHPDTSREFKYNMQTGINRSAHVMADYNHLLMAFNEIIDNCYDATLPQDSIHIEAFKESGNEHLHIMISNKGDMPEDTDILFKPFHTTKAAHCGLGLNIAHTVFTLHDGKMWLTGEAGMSSAHIVLPLVTNLA